MMTKLRWAVAGVLLVVVACCMYLALAVPEAPADSWWAYWVIYTVVGLFCFSGAAWLALPKHPQTHEK